MKSVHCRAFWHCGNSFAFQWTLCLKNTARTCKIQIKIYHNFNDNKCKAVYFFTSTPAYLSLKLWYLNLNKQTGLQSLCQFWNICFVYSFLVKTNIGKIPERTTFSKPLLAKNRSVWHVSSEQSKRKKRRHRIDPRVKQRFKHKTSYALDGSINSVRLSLEN